MPGLAASLSSPLLAAIPAAGALPAFAPVAWQVWVAFGIMVLLLLVLDLFVFHRESHEPTLRESAAWTCFWAGLALAFNVMIWSWKGSAVGVQFLTGYLVEWSLSMDNVFVFAVIFRFFRVPLKYQYRVLFWGILGAILMRLAFILAGAALIKRFDWVLAIFGGILVYTAIKLALHKESDVHPENNIVLRMARRIFRISKEGHEVHGEHFFVRETGRRAITPLFLVLLVIESTDVLFAVDSVPAIFGITKDPFIVFTSNIFAILGLRALYFLLAGFIDLFRYLGYGLSAVLGFIGLKMIAEFFNLVHMPSWLSLIVVVGLLGVAILASIIANRRDNRLAGDSQDQPTETAAEVPESRDAKAQPRL